MTIPEAQTPAPIRADREAFRTRLFFLMLETAGIFLLPALAAVWIGRWLMRAYGFGSGALVGSLVAAFALSWGVVALRYRSAMRASKQFDSTAR